MLDAIFLSLLPKTILDSNLSLEFMKLKTLPSWRESIELILQFKSENEIEFLLSDCIKQAKKSLEEINLFNIKTVHFWESIYPKKLRQIQSPPLVLYFLGSLPEADKKTLSIVGTRKPNRYGMDVLRQFCAELPTTIQHISGLAYGVDSLAHESTLERGIRNFSILANGLDTIYPKEHQALADCIIATGGGIISEYAPGTVVKPYYFPWRNRIIAGLSDLIWIPQASARSGSFHTALHALEQGKPIAVTPGNVFDEMSQLPNRLLMEGAHPITKPADLCTLLGY